MLILLSKYFLGTRSVQIFFLPTPTSPSWKNPPFSPCHHLLGATATFPIPPLPSRASNCLLDANCHLPSARHCLLGAAATFSMPATTFSSQSSPSRFPPSSPTITFPMPPNLLNAHRCLPSVYHCLLELATTFLVPAITFLVLAVAFPMLQPPSWCPPSLSWCSSYPSQYPLPPS